MTELPTAWWCRAPFCGHVAHRSIRHHDMIEVPLLTPDMTLKELAPVLKAAGFEVIDLSPNKALGVMKKTEPVKGQAGSAWSWASKGELS